MLSDSKHNPLGRFDGLAGVYAKYRPSYPAEAIEWIIERLPDRRGTIVDVGCGTGISSRQLAGPGISVIGVEPNESMRGEAEQTPSSGIVYRAGQSEATGLDASTIAELETLELLLHNSVIHSLSNPLIETSYRRMHNYLRLVRLDRKLTGPLALRSLREHKIGRAHV